MTYFPVHAHSEFSVLDGLGSVKEMVWKAASLGQPAMSLTDHGNMAGAIRLYKECKRHGLKAFPGEEFYVVKDADDDEAKEIRWHLGMLALDQDGYKALIRLSSRSHTRERFHRRPLIDFADLAELGQSFGEHVAVLSGCYFGVIVQTLVNHGEKRAMRVVEQFTRWFPNFFIELQHHNIHRGTNELDERQVTEFLLRVADKYGLPVVLGQDSHYCEPSDQRAHDLMKDICYFGDEENDNAFPGGPYHMASTPWLRRPWTGQQWARIEEGHDHLFDLNNLVLPALDDYKFHVPMVSRHPQSALKRLVKRGMEDRGLDLWQHYNQRASKELRVIGEMGFENYFVFMEGLCGWMKKEGIFFNARGSANGCLVAFVLGITNVDPIEWDTDFDRFLSLDRQKPPDIDLDIESSRRGDVIEWLKAKYPGLVQIGTYGRVGINIDPETGEQTGSVLVQYMAAKSKKDPNFEGLVYEEDWESIELLSELGARKSAGAHAAGFVLPGDGHPIEDYLATMLIASSNTTVTQAVMEDVEDAGYMKADLLGLRALETVRHCVELLGRDPVHEGMAWIPNDDKAACKLLREGRTGTGIFQFDGYSTANGGKNVGIKTTHDAILTLALFRPAMMDSGMTKRYLLARKNKEPESLHPALDNITKATYGVPVFQDDVMKIMAKVGLNYADRNDILKAVKASNDKIDEYAQTTFDRIRPKFISKARHNLGCTVEEAQDIWATVMQFSDYGFNKAHATGYGLMAYRMAYLKAHAPTEYMAALLRAWTGTKKEPAYVAEARRMGLSIGRPNVNSSDVLWKMDGDGTVRRGLLAVKKVGEGAATCIVEEREANGKYTSIEDMIERLPGRPVSGGKAWKKEGTLNGVLEALRVSGALRTIGVE